MFVFTFPFNEKYHHSDFKVIMYNLLQNHGAKDFCRVPDGLPELCSDISREVLRNQPLHIYTFIADYADGLLSTRENAKIAVKLVDSIMADSETIVNLLDRCGLNLKQIATIAPQLQNAFLEYANDTDCTCSITSDACIDSVCNEESKLTIRNIVENAEIDMDVAERAATIIQRAFIKHHKAISQTELTSGASWKQALSRTREILRQVGLSEVEAARTARSIERKYEAYYTRKNTMKSLDAGQNEDNEKKNGFPETDESIQAVAWLNMMYDDSGITREQVNRAATIIQRAFREYRSRRNSSLHRSTSMDSMAARAILDKLHQRISDKVLSSNAIPGEFAAIQEIAKATEKLSNAYEERLDASKFYHDAMSSEEETQEESFKEDNEDLHH